MFKGSLVYVLIFFTTVSFSACTLLAETLDAIEKASNSFYFNENVSPTIRYVEPTDENNEEIIEEEPSPLIRYLDPNHIVQYPDAIDIDSLNINRHAQTDGFAGFGYDIIQNEETLSSFLREYTISFPKSHEYAFIEGILTFRGNHYRNSAAYGIADIQQRSLEQIWEVEIGHIDAWTGVGWTGQPVLVKWPASTRLMMNINPEKKMKSDLVEVIYGTLDGNIYFLDLEDGSSTRPPIDTEFPIKGSVSVDPRGYPLLFAGQGIDTNADQRNDFEMNIFNLIDQSTAYTLIGNDPYAYRTWGAFDSSALVDANTDTLIQAGENGLLYTAKLNTQFDAQNGTISINPEFSIYRYASPISTSSSVLGIENSPAAYKNLLFFADNGGFLQCIDLNTLSPVWSYFVTDDTDSTIVIEEVSENEVYLYTGCEVDLQGDGGYAYIRKFNALTGRLMWEKSFRCFYDPFVNGGILATPAIGEFAVDNLIFFSVARIGRTSGNGILIAMDKSTGETVWQADLDFYTWSSPVLVYNAHGEAFLILCDSGGRMMLFDARSGRMLDMLNLGANIEGSPAVYENMIVVGTRGRKIIGVKIR